MCLTPLSVTLHSPQYIMPSHCHRTAIALPSLCHRSAIALPSHRTAALPDCGSTLWNDPFPVVNITSSTEPITLITGGSSANLLALNKDDQRLLHAINKVHITIAIKKSALCVLVIV